MEWRMPSKELKLDRIEEVKAILQNRTDREQHKLLKELFSGPDCSLPQPEESGETIAKVPRLDEEAPTSTTETALFREDSFRSQQSQVDKLKNNDDASEELLRDLKALSSQERRDLGKFLSQKMIHSFCSSLSLLSDDIVKDMLCPVFLLTEDGSHLKNVLALMEHFEGVMTECFLCPMLESAQKIDQTLIHCILKLQMDQSRKQVLQSLSVIDDNEVTEETLQVMLLHLSSSQEPEVNLRVANVLMKFSSKFPKSIKFGKLIFELVKNLPPSVSVGEKDAFEQVVSLHQSFLKKAIQNELNKRKI